MCDAKDLADSFTVMLLVGRLKGLLTLALLDDGGSVVIGVMVTAS